MPIRCRRPLIPIQAEPAQPFEDYIHSFLCIARVVGVFDAKDERAAGVARVEPIEQSGARPANVQITRWAGRKTNTNAAWNFRFQFQFSDCRRDQREAVENLTLRRKG